MLKTISSITNALGALNYKGTWNASTNTPTLTSSVGTKGDYYVVSVAGSTSLNGETLWGVGDWAVFNGSVWQRVEGGDTINATTVSASTSVSTPVIQSLSSAGGTIKNNGGTNQMQWGSGGGNNLSLEVATNINPANAAVNISPTGTGTVTISPATASTMNNVAIGGTTALAGSFTTVTGTQLNVDNLRLDGNVISSQDTNGTIDLEPNGTGKVRVTNSLQFRSSNLTANGRLVSNYVAAITTTPVAIATFDGTWGHLAIVNGIGTGGEYFTDLVFSSATAAPTVLSAKTISGSPAARTYSMSGGNLLQLAMASGTYEIYSSIMFGLS
jgi:hypothetical protein